VREEGDQKVAWIGLRSLGTYTDRLCVSNIMDFVTGPDKTGNWGEVGEL